MRGIARTSIGLRLRLFLRQRPEQAGLRQLPRVGENSSGPLGPGLLASGLLGTIIRRLQASLMELDLLDTPGWRRQSAWRRSRS